MTDEQRHQRARLAALAMHAQGKTNTRAAYEARIAKFEAEVDPEGQLAPEERAWRVQWALRMQMTRLSHLARVAKKAGR